MDFQQITLAQLWILETYLNQFITLKQLAKNEIFKYTSIRRNTISSKPSNTHSGIYTGNIKAVVSFKFFHTVVGVQYDNI